MSPITVNVRRYAGPTAPANTGPVCAPMRNGIGSAESRIRRNAVSMRSSSSPTRRGTPATRISFPPSWSMSVPSSVTSCSSAACCTTRTTSWICAASTRRPVALEDSVGAVEVQERDGRAAMLGVLAAVEQVPANRGRHVARDVDIAGNRRDRWKLRRCDPAASATRSRRRAPDRDTGPEACAGRGGAHHDLAGRRGPLGFDGRRRGRTGDDQLPVGLARREHVERARVQPHRDAEHDEPRRRLEPADRSQPVPHADRGMRGRQRVVVAGEQEQQRVAAELQETAARRVRDLEQLLEARVDRVGDFFRADLAVPSQPLRHLREARDVGEDHRAVDTRHAGPARLTCSSARAHSSVSRGT